MQRRRFFAARPVQQMPGQRVEVAVQVRKAEKVTVAEPPPATQTTLARAAWLLPQFFDRPTYEFHESWGEQQTDGRWLIVGDTHSLESIWEGTPLQVDPGTGPLPIPGPDFRCTEITVASNWQNSWPGRVFFGVLHAVNLTDVRWELQWDAEWSGAQNVYGTVDFDPSDASFIVSRNGHRASTWDTVVMVRVWPTGGGADANDTLTAIAYSGATEVARLKFTAYQQAY